LHNPIDNIPLGSFDIPKLDQVCIRGSILKNVSYPGKLLFCKGWRQNKVFSIDQKSFLDGKYEDHVEVPELKFPSEIEAEGSGNFYLFSHGDRLIHRNYQEFNGKTHTRFFDTKGKSVSLQRPADTLLLYQNALTVLQQQPADALSKKKSDNLQNGYMEAIDGFTMTVNKVYMHHDMSQADLKGIFSSSKFYDWSLKKMVEVCHNYDGPIHSVRKSTPIFPYSAERR
jgi:hypothetical protein